MSVASRSGVIDRLKVIRREETTLRLGGQGDNYHMTWAADNRQFVAVCDGTGWNNRPEAVSYNSRLWTISGDPHDAKFAEVEGYPKLPTIFGSPLQQRYYGFGTLAFDGQIVQYLSTPNHIFEEPNPRFVGAKLIYSPDNGRTWHNNDGSKPVRWEPWAERSRANMIFFEEDQDAFSLISLLQMGRDYGQNRDGYVYGYSPNGGVEGTMNQLVLFRVPKKKILQRNAYEFYGGFKAKEVLWTSDIALRVPVLTFPSGWVNRTVHPWAWMPSVVYNAPLDLYMMTSWGTGLSPTDEWFGKPSYLGFWVSNTPWGPWEQIHEETKWMPAGDGNARAFAPQISPKWIAPDGRSFWIVWADFQKMDEAACKAAIECVMNRLKHTPMARSDVLEISRILREHMPYYSFNTQRVDLVVAE